MKNFIIISILSILVFSCNKSDSKEVSSSEKIREEILERYSDGKKKTLVIYKGEGSNEVLVESITFSEMGDTIWYKKPLENFIEYSHYYPDGTLLERVHYIPRSKSDSYLIFHGRNTQYYPDGSLKKEKIYEKGELIETREY